MFLHRNLPNLQSSQLFLAKDKTFPDFKINNSERTMLSQTLCNLDLRGAREVNEMGILIALSCFEALKNILCRNELLCAAIEYIAGKESERGGSSWNLHAIRKLECGAKQRLMHSSFERNTGMHPSRTSHTAA